MPQHARFSSRQHETVAGGTVERLLRKASAHLDAGRLGEAERLYQRLLKSEPGHAGAVYKLGLIASQQGNADLALPYLTAALRAEPGQPQHWLSLATAVLIKKAIVSPEYMDDCYSVTKVYHDMCASVFVV